MKIIIVGAGSVGFQLAKNLISEGKDVVLIEKDPKVAEYVSEHLDCTVVNNWGNNFNVLKNAGTNSADVFISVTDSDEVNIINCAIASKSFNIKSNIARIRNLDYSKFNDQNLFDINFVVNPEIEASNKIVETVRFGALSPIMHFEQNESQIRYVSVNSNSIFKNKIIKNLKKKINDDFLIAAILHNDTLIIPKGDTKIKENDTLFIVSNNNENNFFKEKIRKILIVGGGKLGKILCNKLKTLKYDIAVVEKDYDKSKQLADIFPELLVINEDITDENIFNAEEFYNYDLIITTTRNYELNILTGLYAKNVGVKRSIALVEKNNYISVASKLGIDVTVSPKSSSVDSILRFLRKGNLKTLYSVFEDLAEIAEYSITNKSKILNKAIKDIKLPPNSLIISVARDKKTYIPNGFFVIKEGDSIITITEKKSVNKIENTLF